MFERLAQAVEELEVPASAESLDALFGIVDRLSAKVSSAVGELDDHLGWSFDGSVDLTAWLRAHAGLTRVQAAREATVARRLQLLGRLGLATADFVLGGHVLGTHVPTGTGGATAVPGVWVAGNVADPTETVVGAAAAGLRTAHTINLSLIAEDTEVAVAARRGASLSPAATGR